MQVRIPENLQILTIYIPSHSSAENIHHLTFTLTKYYPRNIYFYPQNFPMRAFLIVVMLFVFVSVKSQSVVSPGVSFYRQQHAFNNGHLHNSLSTRKWFFSSYSGLSTSISFFKGGNASIFSAPLVLQLNRRLSNNWYAFVNVSVAPSYVGINPSYLGGFNKNFSNNPFKQNSFGLYPAASMGVMYMNDAKTFSISGSVSAERGYYPGMPYYPVSNVAKSPLLIPARQ